MTDFLTLIYYILTKTVTFLFDLDMFNTNLGSIIVACAVFGFVIVAVLVTAGMGSVSGTRAILSGKGRHYGK